MSRSEMPPPLPSKLYFRIGEVANLVGVEPHVLRYWEREFRTIRPTKSAKGQRVYSRKDVEHLIRVRELLYAEGFTIAGAKKKLQRAPVAESASSEPPAPETAEGAEDDEATATAPPEQTPKARPTSPRVRGVLIALRGEVEAFLRELGN